MKKVDANLTVTLVPTVDILAWVAKQKEPPFCVGFAAESDNVVEYARIKRKSKGIPLIVANLAAAAIGSDENEITLIDDIGEHTVSRGPKSVIADVIVNHVSKLLALRNPHITPLVSVKNA
jgi:phosphopantothenoylcysteine decarboxylase/phosphopantothenate--cysteine ligase